MKDKDFAEKIVQLKILTNKISWGSDKKNSLFSLKYEILFLIGKGEMHTPKELITELCLAKSNIANLCNELCKNGLIIKSPAKNSKKEIEYYITKKGEAELDDKMAGIEPSKIDNIKTILEVLDTAIFRLKEIKK